MEECVGVGRETKEKKMKGKWNGKGKKNEMDLRPLCRSETSHGNVFMK